jgi:quinolinate synthase
VHERFTGEELERMRADEPGLRIIAHPECPPDVIAAADFTGSTSGMIQWVKDKRPGKVMLITECSMASNVAVEVPDVEFIRPCNLCPHMKRISLENIYESLVYLRHEVTVDPAVAERARRAVERMVKLTK